MKKILLTLTTLTLLCSINANDIKDISIVATSPERGSLVIRTQNKELKLLSIGNEITDTDLKIIQVLNDKVIAEYNDAERNNHLDIDQIFIYKISGDQKSSKIEYVRNYEEGGPELAKQVTTIVEDNIKIEQEVQETKIEPTE